MAMQKNLLLDQLRKNLNDFQQVDYSQQEEDFLIDLFRTIIDKKHKGQSDEMLKKFVQVEIQKRPRSRQLAKGFFYLSQRAKGKYSLLGDFLIILGLLGEFLNSFDQPQIIEPIQ